VTVWLFGVDCENKLTRRQQCLKIFPRFPFGAESTSEWQPEAAAFQVLAHIVASPPNFPCHSSERNRSTGAVRSRHTHHRISQQQFDLFQAQKINLYMEINRQRLKRKKEADVKKTREIPRRSEQIESRVRSNHILSAASTSRSRKTL
jgi:hypothetical protein